MAKKLWSIFTKDMNCCILTGCYGVERHHVFGNSKKRKALCEQYGYIAPLVPTLHPNGANCTWSDNIKRIDTTLKETCQKDFEEKHGTRKEFIELFGMGYL